MNEIDRGLKQSLTRIPSALAELGLPEEQVDFELDELEQEMKSKKVCICGHPMRRHSLLLDNWDCQPARIWCPCSKPIPVLEAEDLRLFQCQTFGWGARHALTQGIRKSDKALRATRLLANAHCWICEGLGTLYPTPLDGNNFPTKQPAAINALFCQSCLLKARGILLEGNET